MFGLLRPTQIGTMLRDDRLCYQGEYCNLCGSVASAYGFSSRLLVLYDFASLAWLLADRDDEARPYARRNCIKLGSFRRQAVLAPVDRFLAAVSVFACGVKFRDDVIDEGKKTSRVALRYYDTVIQRGEADLVRSGFDLAGLEATLLRQQEVERQRETRLEIASAPSGEAYALVARHLAFLACSSVSVEAAGLVGDVIGRCVYLADAFRDYEKDFGVRHNPLQTTEASPGAVASCRHVELAYYVSSLVLDVDDHVARQLPSLLSRWGRLRDQLLRLMGLGKQTVTMNAACCIPCGDGYVVLGPNDCADCDGAYFLCGGTFCLCCCLLNADGCCCC